MLITRSSRSRIFATRSFIFSAKTKVSNIDKIERRIDSWSDYTGKFEIFSVFCNVIVVIYIYIHIYMYIYVNLWWCRSAILTDCLQVSGVFCVTVQFVFSNSPLNSQWLLLNTVFYSVTFIGRPMHSNV